MEPTAMSEHRLPSLVAAGLAFCLFPTTPLAAAPPAKQAPVINADAVAKSVVAEAGRKGLTVVFQLPPQDLDEDNRVEVPAVAKDAEGELVVVFFRAVSGNRVVHLWQGKSTSAEEFRTMQYRDLVMDDRPEVLVELLEQDPDETRRQVRAFRAQAGSIREILQISYPEQEEVRDPTRFSLGDDKPGHRIDDVMGNGDKEVMVKREAKTQKVKDRRGDPITLVLGMRESVFTFDHNAEGGGAYVPAEDRFNNFLPSYKPVKVSASSQRLPEDMAKDESDDAVVISMEEALTIETTVDAGKAPPKTKERNPAPHADWGADNNLDTAWVEGVFGTGDKEWFRVDLEEKLDVRLIRVIPVCAASEEDVKSHNEITLFTLDLGGQRTVHIDRGEKQPSDINVLTVLQTPVPERKFAPQVLVFLQPGIQAEYVKLVIDKVRKRGKRNETCVTEMSVH